MRKKSRVSETAYEISDKRCRFFKTDDFEIYETYQFRVDFSFYHLTIKTKSIDSRIIQRIINSAPEEFVYQKKILKKFQARDLEAMKNGVTAYLWSLLQ